MLNKLCLIAIFSIMFLGCSLTGGTETEETKPTDTSETKPSESIGMKEGDTVVARWTGNSYYEGTLEKIDGSKMNIKWLDGSSPKDVDKSDVYEIPKAGAKPDVKVGDMVLAKIQSNSYWNGAEITKIDGDVYTVKGVGRSNITNLDANKIIKITAATAANFKDKAKSGDFLKDAQAKSPAPAKNYKAKNGDKVVALWATNSWYSGKVTKVSGSKITVAWDDGTKPREVDAEKVLPFPNASNTEMPTAEQFVLAKPVSGTKWVYAQTVSVKDKTVEIKESSNNTRSLKAGEVIPLN